MHSIVQGISLMSLLRPAMTLAMTTREFHYADDLAPTLHAKPLCVWSNQLRLLGLQSTWQTHAQHKPKADIASPSCLKPTFLLNVRKDSY